MQWALSCGDVWKSVIQTIIDGTTGWLSHSREEIVLWKTFLHSVLWRIKLQEYYSVLEFHCYVRKRMPYPSV